MRRLALAPLVALALAACSAGASQPPGPPAGPSGPSGSAVPSPSGASGLPPELEAAIVADAASRASVAPEKVTILQARAVTWNDGSLGCPEPGQFYTQALVDGFHILADAGGTKLDYRAGRNGQFKLCANPAASPGGGPDDY